MPGTTELSLTEFAKGRPIHTTGRAFMDTLPPEIRDECIEGYQAGLAPIVITEWLKAQGYPCSKHAVGQWLRQYAPRGRA